MLTGALQRAVQVSNQRAGALSFVGALAYLKKEPTPYSDAGALSFAGSLTRTIQVSHATAGALSFAGAATNDAGVRYYTNAKAGVLSFTGASPTKSLKMNRTKTGAFTLTGECEEGYKEALYYGVRNP